MHKCKCKISRQKTTKFSHSPMNWAWLLLANVFFMYFIFFFSFEKKNLTSVFLVPWYWSYIIARRSRSFAHHNKKKLYFFPLHSHSILKSGQLIFFPLIAEEFHLECIKKKKAIVRMHHTFSRAVCEKHFCEWKFDDFFFRKKKKKVFFAKKKERKIF